MSRSHPRELDGRDGWLAPSGSSLTITKPHVLFFNLPKRVLERLFALCHNKQLITLASTCRFINEAALAHFLDRNNCRPVFKRVELYCITEAYIPEASKALRLAFSITDLDTITFTFSATDPNHLYDDSFQLCGLLRRLPPIRRVHLRFNLIDEGSAMNDANSLALINRRLWQRSFTNLLDAALEKGSKEIAITAGRHLVQQYQREEILDGKDEVLETASSVLSMADGKSDVAHSESPTMHLEKAGAKQSLKRMWKPIYNRLRRGQDTGREKTSGTSDKSTHSMASSGVARLYKMPNPTVAQRDDDRMDSGALSALSIESPFMALGPFLPWTLRLITSSTNLSGLILKSDVLSEIIRSDSPRSASLQFPKLETFEITSDVFLKDEGPSFNWIYQFLLRHSTIIDLSLRGVQSTEAVLHSSPEPGILPCLTRLAAHPWYVALIAKSHVMAELLPSKLERVAICAEEYGTHYPRAPFDFASFDDAIHGLSKLGVTSALEVRVAARWYDNSFAKWIKSHLGREDFLWYSTVHIKKFIIAGSYLVQKHYIEDMVTLLPPYLDLFANIEHVEFSGLGVGCREVIEDLEFERGLARCRNIKRYTVEGRTYEVLKVEKRDIHADASTAIGG